MWLEQWTQLTFGVQKASAKSHWKALESTSKTFWTREKLTLMLAVGETAGSSPSVLLCGLTSTVQHKTINHLKALHFPVIVMQHTQCGYLSVIVEEKSVRSTLSPCRSDLTIIKKGFSRKKDIPTKYFYIFCSIKC